MFYNYCPECGTESQPFVSEPNDGTPIRCRYCGTVYRYKTRHWGVQRVVVRLLLLVGIVAFCTKGCFRDSSDGNVVVESGVGEEKAEANAATAVVRRASRKKMPTREFSLDKIDITKGFGFEFLWGSFPHDGEHTGTCNIEYKLEGDIGYDRFIAGYREGVGLVSISLVKRKLDSSKIEEFTRPTQKKICDQIRGKGKSRCFESKKQILYLIDTIDGFVADFLCDNINEEKNTCDVRFTVFNVNLFHVDVFEVIRFCGLHEVRVEY